MDFIFSKPTPGPLRFSMINGWQAAVTADGIPVLRCDSSCTVYSQRDVDMVHAIACRNACEGLRLSYDMPPGALTDLVTAARRYAAAHAVAQSLKGVRPMSLKMRQREAAVAEGKAGLADLRKALAKFSP